MRIILSTSPHIRHAAVLQNDFEPSPDLMYSFLPLGLLSLVAALRKTRPKADDCSVYDINRRISSGTLPLDGSLYLAVARELVAAAPDVVGFMTECDSYHHVLQICDAIKVESPRCKLVLGGPQASAVADATMKRCSSIDAIVIGEGELTFPHLVEAFALNSADPVPGTLRRLNDGALVEGGSRALLDNLDNLPVPAYDIYTPDLGEEIFLEVGRGCPFQCEFCSTAPYWQRKHRVKSAGRIVDEIYYINRLFGKRRVHFTHDLFTTHHGWVTSVCEHLITHGQPIRWTCSARTDTVDRPLLDLMAKAGCDAIYFGIESGSERILQSIKKDIPLSQSFNVLETCKATGITPNVGFIIGFPEEDLDSAMETLTAYERALRLGCKPAHIFSFNPFYGSPLYQKLATLECDGHFVDLPLGPDTDVANRGKISSDQVLFSSYFRPVLPALVVGEDGALGAIDEFSPLVEAALMPALILAKRIGGMYKLFQLWLRWIRQDNTIRHAPIYRLGYGSPARFAQFLIEALSGLPEQPKAGIAAAQAIEINFRVGERHAPHMATSMATHRSLASHRPETINAINLRSQLVCTGIMALLSTQFDVRPVLRGEFMEELPHSDTFLIWQHTDDGSVRLLDVDEQIFDTVQTLMSSNLTAGDLLLKQFSQGKTINPDHVLHILSSLAEERILAVRN